MVWLIFFDVWLVRDYVLLQRYWIDGVARLRRRWDSRSLVASILSIDSSHVVCFSPMWINYSRLVIYT
jgi:hypothetical protein